MSVSSAKKSRRLQGKNMEMGATDPTDADGGQDDNRDPFTTHPMADTDADGTGNSKTPKTGPAADTDKQTSTMRDATTGNSDHDGDLLKRGHIRWNLGPRSHASHHSHSSQKRQKHESELRAMEEIARLEMEQEKLQFDYNQSKLRKQLELAQKRLEVEKARIDEVHDDANEYVHPEITKPIPNSSKASPWYYKSTRNKPDYDDPTDDEQDDDDETKYSGTKSLLEKMLARQSVPKDLPIFSGEPAEWPLFIRQYEHTTKMCGLSDEENSMRLAKCLKGKAYETVCSMLGIPENVSMVIETLQMTFGRPEQIIKTMILKAKSVPSVNESQPETLLNLSNAVRSLVATMRTLKCTAYMLNPQLMEELLEKLPASLQLQWCFVTDDKNPDLYDFSEWLTRLAKAACKMPASFPKPTESVPDRSRQHIDSKGLNLKKQQLPHRLESRIPGACIYCKQPNHKLPSCFEFKKADLDRRWKFVSEKKLCFVCLSSGHQTKNCSEKKECGQDGCRRSHHPLLHKPIADPTTSTVFKPSSSAFVGQCSSGSSVLLKYIPLKVEGPGGIVETFAFLDDGSTTSVIDKNLAEFLQLDGEISPLYLKWTNDQIHEYPESRKVTVKLSGTEKTKEKFNVRLRTTDSLNLPMQDVDMEAMRAKWPHLIDVPFDSIVNARPRILIGQDNLNLMITRKTICGDGNDPVGTKTPLGWVVHGPAKELKNSEHLMFHYCPDDDDADDKNLDKMIQDSFSLEMYGVTSTTADDVKIDESNDDRAMRILRSTTKRIGERFETGLLWKDDDFRFPASYQDAFQRLRYMERKMDKDVKFAAAYCDKIQDYVSKGYAKKLTIEDANVTKPITRYIPHFAVFNPNKPGKMRFVFDAAAKSGGVSLNDALLKGPDLLQPIPAILWRFRRGIIGFSGDIKEMFHQVRMRPDDQDALRFLWRGNDRNRKPDIYQMEAMIFGAACSPASAIFARDLNAEEFRFEFPEAADAIQKNTYMDDTIESCDSVADAEKRILEIIEVYRRGGFVCCNWFSNSRNVMRTIPVDLRAANWKDVEVELLPTERILGMFWKTETDSFTFRTKFHKVDVTILNGSKMPTKRQILQVVMSIFDPLGLIAHFTIKGRILFQEVWKDSIGWDDVIPEKFTKKWIKWIDEIKLTTKIEIPRCYSEFVKTSRIQIHIFNDASQQAYACTSYLRIEHDDKIEVVLVNAKARVKPIKEVTIPRMELQAALLGSRLASTILQEIGLTIDTTIFWSDSQAVICWIQNKGQRLPRWESTRIAEILKSTNVNQWRWVPTNSNPADLATRQDKPTDFDVNSMWFSGPDFLQRPEREWPVLTHPSVCNHHAEFIFATTTDDDDDDECYCLPDPERFDCWLKLIRATGWLLRYFYNCRNEVKKSGELTIDELNKAEILWVKCTQNQEFRHEKKILMRNRDENQLELLPKSSKLHKFSMLIDDNNVIRLRGRTDFSCDLKDDTKSPYILDSSSRYVFLLLTFHHRQLGHRGMESVIYRVQQKYWILGLRNSVKKVVRLCQFCCNQRATFCDPEMGLLPYGRVNSMSRPFTSVGLDYFGPMRVKVGKKIEKRYGLIFCCMTIRAIHIEMTERLTTDSTLLAIRRFLSRRGYPSDIFSDNGLAFRGCERELRDLVQKIDSDEIQRSMTAFGISWKFSPPATPHWGGSYERMIRSVKTALNATLRERLPKPETLSTLLCEAEFIVNSRPLTHVSVDPNDLAPLTPLQFLITGDRRVPSWSDPNPDLRKQYQVAQQYTDNLWSRWVKEYLPILNLRPKWNTPSKLVKVDDVALVADPSGPRNSWPIGIVERVLPGKDGIVRMAEVRANNKIYRRGVRSLVILDVRGEKHP